MSTMASPERSLSHTSLQQAAHWYVLLHDDAPVPSCRRNGGLARPAP